MKDELMDILIDNGLEYEGDSLISEIDSLQYMSLLVNIEEKFDFEFPDSYLGQDIFGSFNRLYEIIVEVSNS